MVFETWVFLVVIGALFPVIGAILYGKTVTVLEAISIVSLNSLIMLFVVYAGTYTSLLDREILNGRVVSKSVESVSCSHSYSCRCRTVSCGKNCTTTKCDTCYLHRNDWDYVVDTSVGRLKIEREELQGSIVPSRYQNVVINEPVSVSRVFTNYIKGAPDSLFNKAYLLSEEISVPEYPEVYDVYRIKRVINDTQQKIDIDLLNSTLNERLKTLGESKELNIVVVFHDNKRGYDETLEAKWLGGKQNDVIVSIGIEGEEIKSVHSFGFSQDSRIFYAIEREIKELTAVTGKEIAIAKIILETSENSFVRRDMETYKYLEDSIDPPTWLIVLASIISILGSAALTRLAHRHEFFG